MSEPRTEAGKRLFSRFWETPSTDAARISQIIATLHADILAIEDEALTLREPLTTASGRTLSETNIEAMALGAEAGYDLTGWKPTLREPLDEGLRKALAHADWALSFHNQTPSGRIHECLAGCIACESRERIAAALAAKEPK